MNTMTCSRTPSHAVALLVAAALAGPTLGLTAGCGNNSGSTGGGTTTANAPAPAPANPGLSTKQKVVLLAGAALLYYIYRKDKANNAAAAAGSNGRTQLYREDKGPNAGAIYYRKNDARHTVVWVTSPSQPVAVPAAQVQQYAPDYQQYQGQAGTPPAGAMTQSATQFDPSLGGGGYPSGPGGPTGPGG